MDEALTLTTQFEIQILARPAGTPGFQATDWRVVDGGPGLIHLPAGDEIGVRAKALDDRDLTALVKELTACPRLIYLNLSENRNVTDQGLAAIRLLPGLRMLNLSSCSLTNSGLDHLKALPKLEILDLSYCNRLTDLAVRSLKKLSGLSFLDLQGCVKITHGGLARLQRRGLTIHK